MFRLEDYVTGADARRMAPRPERRDLMLSAAKGLQKRAWDHAARGDGPATDRLAGIAAWLERQATATDPRALRDRAANTEGAPAPALTGR
ncbi:MAG: hypothetical protein ACU0BS_10340 [Hasllibacter sp.]